jgi:hypothetical protein
MFVVLIFCESREMVLKTDTCGEKNDLGIFLDTDIGFGHWKNLSFRQLSLTQDSVNAGQMPGAKPVRSFNLYRA